MRRYRTGCISLLHQVSNRLEPGLLVSLVPVVVSLVVLADFYVVVPHVAVFVEQVGNEDCLLAEILVEHFGYRGPGSDHPLLPDASSHFCDRYAELPCYCFK